MDFLIGKPYSFRNFNCWDYVAEIRAQAGIETKLFKVNNLDNAYKLITSQMQKLDHGLCKVDEPVDYDVVICSHILHGKKLYHCGLFYGGLVLHCSRSQKQVVSEKLNEFIENYGEVTFWR